MAQWAMIMDITPTMASEWLEHNTHNRNLRMGDVEAYARDMVAGKWHFNGESIKISDDLVLLDGQHRLEAVVLSGVTIRSLVVFGLSEATQETVDVGVKRLYADQLKLRGESSATVLAALLRRVKLWKAGDYTLTRKGIKFTKAELDALLEEEGDSIRRAALRGARLARTSGIHPSILSFCYWLLSPIDQDQADWFFDRLGDGVGLPAQHPALVLRERLAGERNSKFTLEASYIIALVIISWNAYREGRPLKSLKIPVGGLTRENFPKPK